MRAYLDIPAFWLVVLGIGLGLVYGCATPSPRYEPGVWRRITEVTA